ncbi:MAG: gfo/Idh/MocA family oxidoreductase [Planctomycetia bacterium]|nr:gfo/Idh/MocA family oxidoreductase [Planctomycetia bacterium]
MDQGNLSRRGFVQRSLAAMAAAGLPAWTARELLDGQLQAADAAKKPVAASDKITIGLIGCGGQGRGIMNQARNSKMVEVVAVADVDKTRREQTASSVGKDCKAYEDFRELNDRKDIQAILVGTPEHWHTLCSIDAMKKGKDVYCEKPLTLTVAEGQALVRVAKATKAIFQVGSQQRSDARFRHAAELVRNGRLGKIKRIETRIGDNPVGGPFKTVMLPPELNWEFWQGPVSPHVEYVKERCHYQFRWWYEYSGGKMTDWGAHHNDQAQWALGMDDSGPIEIIGKGDKPSDKPNSYNCHPNFEVTYTYSNGAQLVCMSGGENGVKYEGEDGKWIFVSRSLITASDEANRPQAGKKGVAGKPGSGSKLLNEPLGKDAIRLYAVKNGHMNNFLEGIKTRKPCVCTAEIGHRSVSVCHIGVISTRLGKKLKWDPVKEQFDDADANKMLAREYHRGWKLEG